MGDYIKGTVSDDRIARGQRYRAELSYLPGIEQRYGVPPRHPDRQSGPWRARFGAVQGDFDVVRCMASLAYHGRRRNFAEGELIAALRIIDPGEANRAPAQGLLGRRHGPDPVHAVQLPLHRRGQRRRRPARHLGLQQRRPGLGRQPAGQGRLEAPARAGRARSPCRPSFDYGLTEGLRGDARLVGPGGRAPRRRPALGRLGPGLQGHAGGAGRGRRGPIFLLFPNHFAIRTYNNSTAYALGIGLLADRFAGGGPLVKAWPYETPLAIGDRIAAQTALLRLGFNPGEPDGVVGVNTRTALRNWQKARGLIADGYLSPEMVRRLNVEAGALPMTPAPTT